MLFCATNPSPNIDDQQLALVRFAQAVMGDGRFANCRKRGDQKGRGRGGGTLYRAAQIAYPYDDEASRHTVNNLEAFLNIVIKKTG